jgi:hypothetical protein
MSEEMINNKNENENDNVFIEKISDISDIDVDVNNTTADDKKWYPGKLIGLMKKNREDNKVYENNINRDENANTTAEIEDIKQEAMIVKTVRGIRNKYLERQLTGRIYIYRMSGVIATAITSDVSSDDIGNYLLDKVEKKGTQGFYDDDLMNKADLSSNYKRALSTTDSILNSLERRSLCWEGAEFGTSTMLTRGTTLGVSDPFIGMIAFSFTIELSCTVHTLLASRKRFEAMKELALCTYTYNSSSSDSLSDKDTTVRNDNTNRDYGNNDSNSSSNNSKDKDINKDKNKLSMLSGWFNRSKSNLNKDDISNNNDNKDNSNINNNVTVNKGVSLDVIEDVVNPVFNSSLQSFSDDDNDDDSDDDNDNNNNNNDDNKNYNDDNNDDANTNNDNNNDNI